MTQPTLFDAPVSLSSRSAAMPLPSVYAAHAAETTAEAGRLASAADRVLAALQTGPQTNLALIRICQRISGRIYDLRRRGYLIDVDPLAPGIFLYTLRGRRTAATTEAA